MSWKRANRPKRRFVSPEPHRKLGVNDHRYGKRRYFVYVLELADGNYYVGHSYSVANRLREHQRGQVVSTKGKSPELIWKSGICGNREKACKYEAAMKYWLKTGDGRFYETINRKLEDDQRSQVRPQRKMENDQRSQVRPQRKVEDGGGRRAFILFLLSILGIVLIIGALKD